MDEGLPQNQEVTGASAAQTGLSSDDGAVSSGVSTLRASIPSAGDWVLFRTEFERVAVELKRAEKVTPKLVKFGGRAWPRQCSLLSVVASFGDEQTARRAQDTINGVAGEFRRRCRAAEDEKARRVTAALIAANQQIERILASGIEAGTGETPEEAARCEAREPARTPEINVLLEKKDA